MKKTWIIISLACAALLASPMAAHADHDKECKATHGTVNAKTDNSITVNGKTFTADRNTKVNNEAGAPAALASVKVGDRICVETPSAESKQAAKLVVLDRNSAAGTDRSYARDKVAELQRETHEKICEGKHGKVTAKTEDTVSIDGKTYAMKIGTQKTKEGDAILLKGLKVGDTVCYTTMAAADGTQQIARLIPIGKDEKVRVREKEGDVDVKKDSPNTLEIETPDKKIEVK